MLVDETETHLGLPRMTPTFRLTSGSQGLVCVCSVLLNYKQKFKGQIDNLKTIGILRIIGTSSRSRKIISLLVLHSLSNETNQKSVAPRILEVLLWEESVRDIGGSTLYSLKEHSFKHRDSALDLVSGYTS